MSEGNGRLVLAAGGPPHTGLLKKWSTEGWEVYEKKNQERTGALFPATKQIGTGHFLWWKLHEKAAESK